MKKPVILSFCLLFFLNACAKQSFEIGKEAPEVEIRKCIYLSKKKLYAEAVECLEIFKSRFPQTQEGMDAELRIGDNYYEQHQYLLAADTYENFVKLHPSNPKVDYAYYRMGLSYFKEAPKAIDRDQKYLVKSAEQFERALQASPQSTYREAILEAMKDAYNRLAERVYYIGHFYYRSGEYIAAYPRFQEVAERFPAADLTPKALYYLTKSTLKVGMADSAKQTVDVMVQNFPDNLWTKKAQQHYLKGEQHGK